MNIPTGYQKCSNSNCKNVVPIGVSLCVPCMAGIPMSERRNAVKVVVIKDMSAGNAEVGEMWQESKIFDGEDRLYDVLRWAGWQNSGPLKKRVTITVAENEEERE